MSFLINFHIKSIRFVFFWTWHFFLSCCIFCFTNPICVKSALVVMQFRKMYVAAKKTACYSGLSRHTVFLFIILYFSAATCYCRLHEATRYFFCSFLWLFLSYTRDFISLCATDSHLPQSVSLGEFPRRKLNDLLVRRLAVKIEFAGGPPGPPKLFLVAFFVVLVPLLQVYGWSR